MASRAELTAWTDEASGKKFVQIEGTIYEQLALLALIGVLLGLGQLDGEMCLRTRALPMVGRMQGPGEERGGSEHTGCKRSSSPSKEVARAVVSLLDRSSRLVPQLQRRKGQGKVLIRGALGRKEELITPVPGLGYHAATHYAQAQVH